MDDLISRQAAIDDVKAHDDGTPWEVVDILYMLNHLPSAHPDGRFINADELIKRLKEAGHEEAAAIALKMAGHERKKNLPSAQSEIIRCKDCIHYNAGFECLIEGYGIERSKDWYCGDAERRTDE